VIVEAVIPIHNRRAVTLACLQRLEAARHLLPSLRVTVVDDGSSDGSSAAIREAYPWVRVLQGGGNLWWSGAMNLGVQAALDGGAEAILSLNDDTEASPALLLALVAAAQQKPGVLWAPLAVHSDDGVLVHSGYVFKPWKGWTAWHEVQPVPAEAYVVQGLPGACVLIPAAAFRAAGLYAADELPQYHADIEFCVRAGRAGFASWVLPGETLKIQRNTRNAGLSSPDLGVSVLRHMFSWPQGVYAPKAFFAFYRRTHPGGAWAGRLMAMGFYLKAALRLLARPFGIRAKRERSDR
jgi:GT2 family glycosyltransferase